MRAVLAVERWRYTRSVEGVDHFGMAADAFLWHGKNFLLKVAWEPCWSFTVLCAHVSSSLTPHRLPSGRAPTAGLRRNTGVLPGHGSWVRNWFGVRDDGTSACASDQWHNEVGDHLFGPKAPPGAGAESLEDAQVRARSWWCSRVLDRTHGCALQPV